MLPAGVALVGVGIGVGLPHLAAAGNGPATSLGVLALVSGVVLVLLGIAGVTRSTPGRWRLLVAPAAVIAAVLGVYVLATPLHAALPARAAAPTSAPAGVATEDVLVPTGDGERLAAWYVPAQEGAAVVLLPGAGSSRSGLEEHVRVLAGGGYGVLALDPRGHGDSSGRGMDWGWHGDEDVAAAVGYLSRRADVDPARIAVVGLSMGGEQAIGAAGADPRIRAVVAEGATARSAADLHWLSDAYGWRGTITEALQHVQTAIADLISPAGPPAPLRQAAAAAAPRRLLLIAAGERLDEQHAAADIKAAAPGNVEVWVVPGAGHIAGLSTAPVGWTERVLGFLDAAMR